MFRVTGIGTADMPDELGRDGEVAPAVDLLPVAARVSGGGRGPELKREDVREAGPEPVHRPFRARLVGQCDGEKVLLVRVVLTGAEQVLEVAVNQHFGLTFDRR